MVLTQVGPGGHRRGRQRRRRQQRGCLAMSHPPRTGHSTSPERYPPTKHRPGSRFKSSHAYRRDSKVNIVSSTRESPPGQRLRAGSAHLGGTGRRSTRPQQQSSRRSRPASTSAPRGCAQSSGNSRVPAVLAGRTGLPRSIAVNPAEYENIATSIADVKSQPLIDNWTPPLRVWPLVHPPAILAPNSTRKEPMRPRARLPALGPKRFRHDGGMTGRKPLKRPLMKTAANIAPKSTPTSLKGSQPIEAKTSRLSR